jgi:hypothetical protein
MSLTKEQKEAFAIVDATLKTSTHPAVSVIAPKVLEQARKYFMSARERLEEIGEVLKTNHDHKAAGCSCNERHQYLMDVLVHLEKQDLKESIIEENLDNAAEAWENFENQFERTPTVTYVESQYTLDTGVAGVYFIHPAAQK